MNRGDVYRVRPVARSGHAQRGARYAVVVQADSLLRLSTVIVAPTSRSAQPATFRPEVEVAGETTRLLVDQLTAVDLGRLEERVGHLTVEEGWSLDEAMRSVLSV